MAVPLDIDEEKLRKELKELLEAVQPDGKIGRMGGRQNGDSTGEKDGNINEVALLGEYVLEETADSEEAMDLEPGETTVPGGD